MLITNATLVNWSPRKIASNRALLIRDGSVAEIGASADMVERYPAETIYDAHGRYVMPGNICAHTHFYSTFSRGLAIPGAPPRDFPEVLRKLWWPLDRALTAESVRLSVLVSAVDAIKHGTTTLFDHHSSPNAIDGSLDVIASAIEQAGLRAVLCYEVSDRNGAEKAEMAIAENARFLKAARDRQNIAATFGLHASLTLSTDTLMKCVGASDGSGFHIHVAEHEADQENSVEREGVRVVERLYRAGILDGQTIAAHGIHLDPWEISMLRTTGTWVTHQPRSNMNNGVGAMAFDTMMRGGVNVCLGNDGFSNDMWAEWKAAYFLHKVVNRDPRAANGEYVAFAATAFNAQLARLFFPRTQLGELASGHAADLIMLDYHPFTPLTVDNLPWHAIFGFESDMISATMVNGKFLMWDRVLLTLDEASIAAEALAHAPEVWARYAANVAAG